MLAANPLISVTPGLMIWTIVCFLIALFELKRYAFGPIQKMIDARREQIRLSLEEAEHAREEARRLLEEHKKLIGQARSEAEQILAEARRTGDAMENRMREETEAERQRRIEETRRAPHLRRGTVLGAKGERSSRTGPRGALRLCSRDRRDAGAARCAAQSP